MYKRDVKSLTIIIVVAATDDVTLKPGISK